MRRKAKDHVDTVTYRIKCIFGRGLIQCKKSCHDKQGKVLAFRLQTEQLNYKLMFLHCSLKLGLMYLMASNIAVSSCLASRMRSFLKLGRG